MSRLTRRWFLRGTAAAAGAACVGCDGDSTDGRSVVASSTTVAPDGRAGVPASSTVTADGSAPAANSKIDELPGLTSRIAIGELGDVLAAAAGAPLYVPEARAYLVAVEPAEASALAEVADPALRPGLDRGLLALYQKCPHLGCRVPYCETSGWFECRCHGTLFTALGEHRTGPGPRGLDAFAVSVDEGEVSIDTGRVVAGLALGTVVVDRAPAGPHCVEVAADS